MDICSLCKSVVGIPVRLLKCKNRCQDVYCLHCVRNHYAMGGVQRVTRWPCVNCKTPLCVRTNYTGYLPARHMYQIDYEVAKRLDKIHGRIRCLRCEEPYWRSDYQTHSNNCSKTKKFCGYCRGNYHGTLEEHVKHCPRACQVCCQWHGEFDLCPKMSHICKRCGEVYLEEGREQHPCNIFDKLNPVQKIAVRQWLKCLYATKQTPATATDLKDVIPIDVILMVVQELTTMNYWTMKDMRIYRDDCGAGWYRWYDHVVKKYMVCCYHASDTDIGYDQCQHVDIHYDGQIDRDQLDLYKRANDILDNEPETYLLAGYMINRIQRTSRNLLQKDEVGLSAYKTTPPYKDIREAIRKHGFCRDDLPSMRGKSLDNPTSYCKVYSGGLTHIVYDVHYTHTVKVLTTLDSPTVSQESLETILKLYMSATKRFVLRTSWYDRLVEDVDKSGVCVHVCDQWEMYRLLKNDQSSDSTCNCTFELPLVKLVRESSEWYINYMERHLA